MVAEKVYKIPLADLTVVRVRCEKCRKTAELTVEQAKAVYCGNQCKFCGEELFVMDEKHDNPFLLLGKAWDVFAGLKTKVAVEFIISADE